MNEPNRNPGQKQGQCGQDQCDTEGQGKHAKNPTQQTQQDKSRGQQGQGGHHEKHEETQRQ